MVSGGDHLSRFVDRDVVATFSAWNLLPVRSQLEGGWLVAVESVVVVESASSDSGCGRHLLDCNVAAMTG